MEMKREKLLLLLKLDVEQLFDKIEMRFDDYMGTFALKRTREHFKEIFYNRYRDLSMQDLHLFSEELIVSLGQFYKEVSDLSWYLAHTEDMPSTAEENVRKWIKSIKRHFDNLQLYLSAELEIDKIDKGENDSSSGNV